MNSLRSTAPFYEPDAAGERGSGRQEPELVPLLPEQLFVRDAQPALDHGRIDAAEVRGVRDVPVVDERGQVWSVAVQSLLHAFAQREHHASGAVVGAAVSVLGNSPPELTPGEHEHVIRLPL